jgi:hypothetical protein
MATISGTLVHVSKHLNEINVKQRERGFNDINMEQYQIFSHKASVLGKKNKNETLVLF